MKQSRRYEAERPLGPSVWLVVDRLSGLRCVRKTAKGAGERLALSRELAVLAQSRHPGIRAVLGSEGSPVSALVLELVEGTTLAESAGLDAQASTRVVVDVLAALEHLHRSGTVHADLKPTNIVVEVSGRARLIDLGLALPFGAPVESGTFAYLPPEQRTGGQATVAGDLYALGRTLLERLPALPPLARDLLVACTADKPRDRPASALACLSALGAGENRLLWEGSFPRVGGDALVDSARAAIARDGGESVFLSAAPGSGVRRLSSDIMRAAAATGRDLLCVDPNREPEWVERTLLVLGRRSSSDRVRDLLTAGVGLVREGTSILFATCGEYETSALRALAAAVARESRGALVVVGPGVEPAGRGLGVSLEMPPCTVEIGRRLFATAGARIEEQRLTRLVESGIGIGELARIARAVADGRSLDEAIERGAGESPEPVSTVEVIDRAKDALARGRSSWSAQVLEQAYPGLSREPAANPEAARILARALVHRGAPQEGAAILRPLATEDSLEDVVVLAGALERAGDYASARTAALRAMKSNSAVISLEAHAIFAHVALALGDPRGVLKAVEAGMAKAPDVAPPARAAQLARLFNVRSDAALRLGDAPQAIALAEEAVAFAAGHGDAALSAQAVSRLASAFALSGRSAEAASRFAEALELADRAGDVGALPVFIGNLAAAEHAIGRYGEALEHYREAAALARQFGREANWLGVATNLAGLLTFLGAEVEARHLLDEATSVAEKTQAVLYGGQLRLNRAELLARSDTSAAARLAAEAESIFGSIGAQRQALEASLLSAEIAFASRRNEPAERLLRDRREHLAQAGLATRADLLEGRVLAAKAEVAAAIAALDVASSAAHRQGDRELLARILHERGCVRDVVSPGAGNDDHARARALLREIEAALPPGLAERFLACPERAAVLAHAPAERAQAPRPILGVEARRLLGLVRRVLLEGQESRILETAIDEALAMTGAERAFLLVVGRKGKTDVAVARNFDRETLRRSRSRFSRSIAARVIATQQTVVTASAPDDPALRGSSSVLDLGLRSVLCVPIRAQHGTLGAIYLDHRFEVGRFADEKPELVLALADIVGLALENARLIEEATRRATELEAKTEAMALDAARKASEVERLAAALRSGAVSEARSVGIVGSSPKIRRALGIAERVAASDIPVVILGESGTGKELFARYVHDQGARAARPFIAINCGAIPESLIESELFGHMKGAFTGATRDAPGVVRLADTGTLFLDEVAEMPLRMQVRLLRVLQEGEVRPVGSTSSIRVDVRVVAATHKNLEEAVVAGHFREDLYYRLVGAKIALPPLRERKEDIVEIAVHVVERLSKRYGRPLELPRTTLEALLRHDWPGNVRELEQALSRGALLSTGPAIEADLLELPSISTTRRSAVEAADRAQIERALVVARGNKKRAAETLGVSRVTLYRWLRRYGIS